MTDAEQPSQPNIPAKGGLVTYVMVDGGWRREGRRIL